MVILSAETNSLLVLLTRRDKETCRQLSTDLIKGWDYCYCGSVKSQAISAATAIAKIRISLCILRWHDIICKAKFKGLKAKKNDFCSFIKAKKKNPWLLVGFFYGFFLISYIMIDRQQRVQYQMIHSLVSCMSNVILVFL